MKLELANLVNLTGKEIVGVCETLQIPLEKVVNTARNTIWENEKLLGGLYERKEHEEMTEGMSNLWDQMTREKEMADAVIQKIANTGYQSPVRPERMTKTALRRILKEEGFLR